ncbi:MAG: hydrolase [Eubacteriales bacterium]
MLNKLLLISKRNKVILISVTLIFVMVILAKVVLLDIVFVGHQYEKNRIITPWGEKIKSGNLSVDYTIEQTLNDIERLGLNTVNVPVQIDISSLTSNTMNINLESKKKAIQLIKKLKYRGINVILEPFPYIKNGELYETQLNPTDINEWFWNWKQLVLIQLIDDIAKPYKVYAFCIGSNFDQFEDSYGYWTDVADFVREAYKGKITYRTNWWYTAQWNTENDPKHDTYSVKLNNPVLGKLDFISVAAYFELTDKDTNTVDELVNSIYSTQLFDRNQNVFKELENLSTTWNKPIFFGELGFPKRNKASIHPWNPSPSDIKNDQEQANCFQAYKEVFEKETWNYGFSVFAIGKDDEDKHYYPSNQSAEVIKSWYEQTSSK